MEVMSDLISRSALIEALKRRVIKITPIEKDKDKFYHDSGFNCGLGWGELIANEQPTVEAKPVVRGKWVHLGGDEWCCSGCGHVIFTEGSWEKPTDNFCSNCGADMRGEKHD